MVLISDAYPIDYEPLSGLLIKTIVGALTILTAFSFRDTAVQGVALITPNDLVKKFMFTVALTFLFLFLTVLAAWLWQDKMVGDGIH